MSGSTTGNYGEQGEIFDDLTFPEEITIGILNEVAEGDMTAEEANEQFEIMVEGAWITQDEATAAYDQAIGLETKYNESAASDDLSE